MIRAARRSKIRCKIRLRQVGFRSAVLEDIGDLFRLKPGLSCVFIGTATQPGVRHTFRSSRELGIREPGISANQRKLFRLRGGVRFKRFQSNISDSRIIGTMTHGVRIGDEMNRLRSVAQHQ